MLQGRAFGHDRARRARSGWSGRNRVTGERNGSPRHGALAAGERRRARRRRPASSWSSARQMRAPPCTWRCAQFGERVQGSVLPSASDSARKIAQSSRGLARREGGALGHLRAAFGVDVGHRTFRYRPRPAGSRRRDARPRRHGCRYRPRRSSPAPRCRSRRRRAGTARRASPALAAASMPPRSGRPRPAAKPRSSAPTRAAAVCSTLKPFQPSLTAPTSAARSFAAAARTAAPSGARKAPCPTMIMGFFGDFGERMLAPSSWPSALGTGAEIVVVDR